MTQFLTCLWTRRRKQWQGLSLIGKIMAKNWTLFLDCPVINVHNPPEVPRHCSATKKSAEGTRASSLHRQVILLLRLPLSPISPYYFSLPPRLSLHVSVASNQTWRLCSCIVNSLHLFLSQPNTTNSAMNLTVISAIAISSWGVLTLFFCTQNIFALNLPKKGFVFPLYAP